jgi:hypothetical protein
MATAIEAQQPELLGQCASMLFRPHEVTLSNAMYQDDRLAFGATICVYGELCATATGDFVYRYGAPPALLSNVYFGFLRCEAGVG